VTRELRAKVGADRTRRLYGSRRDAFVAMVQAANLRNFDDPSRRHWLNRSTDGRVLSQRQVRPGLLVVFEVRLQDAAQASFIQDNHVIQALATNRPDQPLNVSVIQSRQLHMI
jgi:hypothetical protein